MKILPVEDSGWSRGGDSYPTYQGVPWLVADLCFVAEEVELTGKFPGMVGMYFPSVNETSGASEPWLVFLLDRK